MIVLGPSSLEVMIKQRQESRMKQTDSFLDDLAAKYGSNGKKSKGTKRKATSKSEPAKIKKVKDIGI